MAADRRLLWRAALFLWMIRLSAMRSITLVEVRNTAWAALLSPASTAFFTFLIAVRSVVRRLALCARAFLDWRARFSACFELAMVDSAPDAGVFTKTRYCRDVCKALQNSQAHWTERSSLCAANRLAFPALPERPPHEPSQGPCRRQQHYSALTHSRLRPRYRGGAPIRRRARDRCVFRRLQNPQLAAPFIRRRGLLSGFRAHLGGVQEPPRPGGHARSDRQCHGLADGDSVLRHPIGGDCRAADRLRERLWFYRRTSQVRPHRQTAAYHLPLHPVHLPGVVGRWHSQYLEPLQCAGFPPGAAECFTDRVRLARCALLRPADHGACLGRVLRRSASARLPAAAPRQAQTAPATAVQFQTRRRVAHSQAHGSGGIRRLHCPDQSADQHVLRLVSRHRRGILALLRRSADGVPGRVAGRRLGDDSASQPCQTLHRQFP